MSTPWEDEEVFDGLKEAVHTDLANRIDAFDGSMLVKYCTLAEIMGSDGERALVSLASKDMKTWESLGMIEYMRQMEQAGAVIDGGEE